MEGAKKFSEEWNETIPYEDVPYESVPPTIKNEPQEQFDPIFADSYAGLQPVPTAEDSQCLKQPGRLMHADGIQYIDRHSNGETLQYSAKFHLNDLVCELLGDKFLLYIRSGFLLKVSVGQIDIDDMDNFDEAIKVLLNHLTVERVLLDEDGEKCNAAAQYVIEHLRANSTSALECSKSAELLFQLFKIFHVPSRAESQIQEIQNYIFIEETLEENLVDYFQALSKLENRGNTLNTLVANEQFQTNAYANLITEFIHSEMKNYQKQLLDKYPSKMTEKLKKNEASLCFYVSEPDLKLFLDLENTMTENPFNEALNMIRGNFISQLKDTQVQSLQKLTPLSNQIYFFICKSLVELSKELQETYKISQVIDCSEGEWVVQDQADDKNLLKSSLLVQLKMLAKLANYYAPGAETVNQKFPHKFVYLRIKNATSEDMYKHIWLCFLDGSIGHVFSAIPNCAHLFSELIDFYTNYVMSGKFKNASSETIRTITHHLLQFLTQAGAVMTSAKENSMNKKILQNQISGIMKHEVTIEELRDLLEVFTCHWKQHNSVLKSISNRLLGKMFKESVISIQKMLSEIVSYSLAKNVKRLELIDFLRNFGDFLIDLEDVDLKWYVRMQKGKYVHIFMKNKSIEPVDNKWKGTERECHVVKDADLFKNVYTSYEDDDVDLPKHYQMVVIETLLENVNSLAIKRNWANGGNLTESDQLNAMKSFISTVRSLFPYLNEQPDYIQFEAFFHDNVNPLVNAIDKSESSEDFSKRISQVKESFWYIRNQNNIGIEDALKLLQGENQSFDEEILRTTFLLYQISLEDYIKESLLLDPDAKIKIIIKKVQSMTASQLASSWSDNFKQKTLPKILAGLAAVWSILVSKDITSSGKYLKPHIIQILCILRMLSVDQSAQGVAKHLAQVLTGQGKSVILGLSATLLALFGHNVEVICYSIYLAQRDAADFKEMFELFNVSDRISYQTFKDMVDNQVDVYAEIGEDYIYRAIGLPKPNTQSNQKQAQINPKRKNSVILIDEVDVFFLDFFYGNTRSRMLLPVVEGLGEIQMKVWEIIQTSNTDTCSIKSLIEDYITTSNYPKVHSLKAFLDIPKAYTILNESLNELTKVQVTNRTLFTRHLQMMITAAINIHLEPIDGPFFSAYKLDKEGRVALRSALGEFTLSLCSGYNNTFAYFKLKERDFVQNVNGTTNFGYFIISIAALSYAKLPENYPLILGVTGTLTGLNSYEKSAVENHYKIQQFSIMPSFFGSSNLKFNHEIDFKCISTEADWMKAMFNRINTTVSADRSVLVFFDSELNINKFQQGFASQLDRLNILTVNTEPDIKEQYINDAGVAKTVTLATREMGRGVDFKSGATVEKNGGLHVIQTFFSLDVKEETQIKGRTARKDYRGSYEQIVCFEHLVNLQLIKADTKCDSVSYDQLENARKIVVEKKGDEKAKKLASSNGKHDMTVKFYSQLLDRSTTSKQSTHFNHGEAHPQSKTMKTNS